jgi:subtilase family serine protease
MTDHVVAVVLPTAVTHSPVSTDMFNDGINHRPDGSNKMSFKKRIGRASLVAALLVMLPLMAQRAAPGAAGAHMSHFLAVGPQALAAASSTPHYGLFTCQVGQAAFACYDPYQMRTAYHLNSLIQAGYTGAGHTIVIVDAFQSPSLSADLDTFDGFYGLPPRSAFFTQVAPDGLTPFDPTDGNMVGWAAEIALDVEWAHAIAPGANIVLDLAKSNDDSDLLSALKYAVDHNLGDIISQSFGENEQCVDPNVVAAQHQVYAAATMKNITIFASSGDQGAAQPSCDGTSWTRAVSFPADDPLVTAVGGTDLHAAGYCLTALGCTPSSKPPAGTYQGEIAWNEFHSIATGGGFSTVYDAPSYQHGAIHGGNQKGLPDVAYNAAVAHGVLVRFAADWYLLGGTSSGSPQWAAIAAIADQVAGHNLGFINTALYRIGHAMRHHAADLNEVTSGTNSVVETDVDGNPVAVQGYTAEAGWNPATGLGSPVGDNLVNDLVKFVAPDDGTAAVARSRSHGNSGAHGPGHMDPH